MSSSTRERPLSPHLQIYRPQLTSTLSIIHRATGVALSVGAFGVAGWLYLLAGDAAGYADWRQLLATPLGCAAVFGFAWAMMYHLLNGIRHLAWDAGWGLDLKRTYQTGWAVVVLSIVLTALIWLASRPGGAA